MTVELPDLRTMKTSDIMKRFLLIALAAICQFPFSQAAGDRVITEKDSHEIASYFNGYLSGDKSLYGVSSRLGTSAAVQAREQVWKIWKEAVERFYDEGLPPLRALRDSVPGQWTLPSSLEPDAVMPFYWGSKGEKPDHGYPMFLYLHGSGPKDREWSNGFRFGNKILVAVNFDAKTLENQEKETPLPFISSLRYQTKGSGTAGGRNPSSTPGRNSSAWLLPAGT